MNWWQALLGVRTPGDSTLAGIEFDGRGLLPLLLTTGLAVVGLAVALVFYLLEPGRLGVLRRVGLVAVRTSLLVLLGVMIFHPVQCIAVFEGQRPRGVVLLVDNSQSMSQQDRRLTTADRIRVALAKDLVAPGTPL